MMIISKRFKMILKKTRLVVLRGLANIDALGDHFNHLDRV